VTSGDNPILIRCIPCSPWPAAPPSPTSYPNWRRWRTSSLVDTDGPDGLNEAKVLGPAVRRSASLVRPRHSSIWVAIL
jgi:hypothetical protein